MSGLIAAAYKAKGKPYRSVTSHPAMTRHRARSKVWKMIRRPSRAPPVGKTTSLEMPTLSRGRLTASFEYTGSADRAAARAFGLV